MAQVTAALVKELRERSGAGMMDCKKALSANEGDLEAAIDWLRTKGLASAGKKQSRVAAEGLVAAKTVGTKGTVVEINSETDFVARNDQFQGLVTDIASVAFLAGDDVEAIAKAVYPGSEKTVAETLTETIAKIGENMNIRRAKTIEVENGIVASYVHGAVAPGMGKIAVLVGLQSDASADALAAVGKQLAMHIAAANPASLSEADLDPEMVEREKQVQMDKARESGKPEAIIEKMIVGRMKKYLEEVVLLNQTFVIDGETKVSEVIGAAAKEAGATIELVEFVRVEVGEGLEKKEDDFAAEVAAAAGV